MALFGLVSKKEHQAALAKQAAIESEIVALKAQLPQYGSWLLETARAEQYNMPDPSVYGNQAELYRKLSWVLQAVSAVAAAGALTPFEVCRVIADKEPKDIPNHEFELLLQRPNPQDSRYEFLYATIAYWKLTGNAYWFLNRADENSKPDELWSIPSSMIIPVPDGRMFLKGYYYYPGTGAEILLEPWQVMHFRSFNPFSRFIGLSAIEALALVAGGDLGMQSYNTRLFKESNGRMPSVMTFEAFPTDDVWEKIKADTREAARNRDMLMLRGVGQGGVNWLKNAVTHEEMEFLEGRKANQREILDTLAPGLYTWQSGESTVSNAGANRALFNELSVYPMHVMMGEKITNHILPVYGGRPLIGRFEDIRIADAALELQKQDAYSKTHTVDEIREEFYGDKAIGDERGELLPAQISANSGATSQETPAPDPANPPTEQETTLTDPKSPFNAPPIEDEASMKAARDELERWERKAIRYIGKPQQDEFTSVHLTPEVVSRIKRGLLACSHEVAIKALFNRIAADMYPMSAAAMHLEGLKLAIQYAEGRK